MELQLIAREFSSQLRSGGAMPERELQHQIMELTEIIRDDEAALRSRTTTAENRAFLRLAIGQRKDTLAALKKKLAALQRTGRTCIS